jgi:hypothetical protein
MQVPLPLQFLGHDLGESAHFLLWQMPLTQEEFFEHAPPTLEIVAAG